MSSGETISVPSPIDATVSWPARLTPSRSAIARTFSGPTSRVSCA